MNRIAPLQPPYEPEVGEVLAAMMPAGEAPIALFRTFARNLPMTRAMHGWGMYELSRRLSLSLREREIVIDRTCARTGCEYEWGVHVARFAERAGLSRDQIASLTHGQPTDPCWTDPRERLLIRATDALHEGADIGDDLWPELAPAFNEAQLLDLLLLAGWYHAISYVATATRLPLEPGSAAFAGVTLSG